MATSNSKLKQGLAKGNKQPLTMSATGIKALQKGFYIKDSSNIGLRLNHNFNGSYTWIYHYRLISGKKGQIKLGSYPAQSLDDARKAYLEQKAIRDHDEDPKLVKKSALAKKANKLQTLGELIEYFIENWVKIKRNDEGVYQAESYLNKHLVKPFGDRLITTLEPMEIEDYLFNLQKSTPAIAKKVTTDLRKAYSMAINSKRVLIDTNPVVFEPSYEPDESKQRALEDDELKYWFKWMETAPLSRNVKDALLLTLYTGCRTGELVVAEWKHYDLKDKTLLIPKDNAKNDIPRLVQLTEQAIVLIESRKTLHKKYLFPSTKTSNKLNQNSLSKALKEKAIQTYKPELELERDEWTPHDIRRTARTGVGRLGCIEQISELIIGHKKGKLVHIYDKHHYYDEQRHWLTTWCNHLDTLRGV